VNRDGGAPFEKLLAGSVAAHGHLCPGQVVGVRMAMLGLRLLNFEAPPTYPQLKQLIVFVEMDRYAEVIARAIRTHLERGCNLLLLSGGMSVDPDDDVTRQGISLAGATEMHYGAAVLPGAMILVAYLGEVPLLGVPACALHHRTTALDLVLPSILAGERIGKTQLAFLGHGGLTLFLWERRVSHKEGAAMQEINYLRLSITDRCQLRCFYCTYWPDWQKLSPGEILSYE
jgi:FmdE, Molybdenum formylmethanofuran dehydrogenase operon